MKNHRIYKLPDEIVNRQPIVFFDGECTLCSRSVQFLLKHNHSGNLSFARLQSETGLNIVLLTGKSYDQADTVLLLQDNILFGYSTAALKITAHLGLPWRLLGVFAIVPASIRDILYRFIAKNRYNWFGKESFCMVDREEYQKRFLA